MTYREHLSKLKQEVIDKLTKHLQAEELLFSQGTRIVDQSYVEARNQSYSEWQKAQNTYHDFLSVLVNVGSLDEQMAEQNIQGNSPQ